MRWLEKYIPRQPRRRADHMEAIASDYFEESSNSIESSAGAVDLMENVFVKDSHFNYFALAGNILTENTLSFLTQRLIRCVI
jgi:hypothetical protein